MQRRRERKKALWPKVLLGLLLLGIIALGVAYAWLSRQYVAFVNGQFIPREEFERRVRHAQFVFDLQAGSREVDPTFAARNGNLILEQMIAETLMLQEQDEMQTDEGYATEVLDWLVQTQFGGSQDLLESALLGYELSMEWLRSYLAETVLLYEIRDKLSAGIVITEAEMRKFYEENKSRFDLPPMIRTAHIVVATKDRAEQLRIQLQAGADFASLARQESLDLSNRELGGDLGWRARGQLPAPVDEAAWALEQVGQISKVIETDVGFHILRLEGQRAEQERTYDEVSESVKAVLFEAKEAQLWEGYSSAVRDKKRVYVFRR
jgi:foldase protein PrsA